MLLCGGVSSDCALLPIVPEIRGAEPNTGNENIAWAGLIVIYRAETRSMRTITTPGDRFIIATRHGDI
jgi:hypothetical protein